MASEAQKKATEKYLEKFETLRFRVCIGEGDKIKAYAESLGMSLNAYINKLIKDDMEK